jgi:hypothetical protein
MNVGEMTRLNLNIVKMGFECLLNYFKYLPCVISFGLQKVQCSKSVFHSPYMDD